MKVINEGNGSQNGSVASMGALQTHSEQKSIVIECKMCGCKFASSGCDIQNKKCPACLTAVNKR